MAEPRTLILMRHATAGHPGSHRDHDRPLTPAGTRAAAAAGAWLRSTLPPVDAVLCSTSVRTRQTLAAAGIDAPAGFTDELYGGGNADILEQLTALPDSARTVLVIGHAPGIPSTAYELATLAAGGGTGDGGVAAEPNPIHDELRHFSAGALAVLTTRGSWATLAETGARLTTVRHPDG
ncbi:MAG TPA: histidine phosphatase family protein [Nakamurella sp.]